MNELGYIKYRIFFGLFFFCIIYVDFVEINESKISLDTPDIIVFVVLVVLVVVVIVRLNPKIVKDRSLRNSIKLVN